MMSSAPMDRGGLVDIAKYVSFAALTLAAIFIALGPVSIALLAVGERFFNNREVSISEDFEIARGVVELLITVELPPAEYSFLEISAFAEGQALGRSDGLAECVLGCQESLLLLIENCDDTPLVVNADFVATSAESNEFLDEVALDFGLAVLEEPDVEVDFQSGACVPG